MGQPMPAFEGQTMIGEFHSRATNVPLCRHRRLSEAKQVMTVISGCTKACGAPWGVSSKIGCWDSVQDS
jgi:hypothetical protein